tara:strand:+ start:273 stop:581 length:309 start_codon:yes stop_codon:yes gene_type:complete
MASWGNFFWNDRTVFKVTLFAAVSDSVGTYAMWHFGTGVNPHAKPMTSSSMFFFWMIFGTGLGLLDYYPGTGIGALGDRSRHALHGVVGVLACATLYEEAYP